MKLVNSMEWSVTAVNKEMIRDYVEHIIFRFSSDGLIDSIPLYLVIEKSQLIEDVVWVSLGIIELTSTRYRHGIIDK